MPVSLKGYTFVQTEFSDKQLTRDCTDACVLVYQSCLKACELDEKCTLHCNKALNSCQSWCPCYQRCPTGCDSCPSGYCQCRNSSGPSFLNYIQCEQRLRNISLVI